MISKEDNWDLAASDWDTSNALEADNSVIFSSVAINERIKHDHEKIEIIEKRK